MIRDDVDGELLLDDGLEEDDELELGDELLEELLDEGLDELLPSFPGRTKSPVRESGRRGAGAAFFFFFLAAGFFFGAGFFFPLCGADFLWVFFFFFIPSSIRTGPIMLRPRTGRKQFGE
jgi:hypothetical protein